MFSKRHHKIIADTILNITNCLQSENSRQSVLDIMTEEFSNVFTIDSSKFVKERFVFYVWNKYIK